MKSNLTVTIAASVLNEEVNIVAFLRDLLSQELPGFILTEILLISDGSTDQTVARAHSVNDSRIVIVDSSERKGKTARLNEAFLLAKTDIIVILDADIRMRDTHSLHALLLPFTESDETVVTSGNAIPLKPVSIAEHIAWVSDAMWKNILDHTKNTSMYRCEGKIRAIHQRLYTTMKFPLASADDVYPYLEAKKMGLGFVYCKNAAVLYQLPITWNDYIKQNVRFLQSKNIQSQFVDEETLEKGYVVSTLDKCFGLARFFPTHPFWTSVYLCSTLWTKFLALLPYDDQNGKWDIISSTKRLRGQR